MGSQCTVKKMKRMAVALFLLSLGGFLAAQEIIRLTFDEATIGGDPDPRNHIAGVYQPGSDETLANVDDVLVRFFDPLGRGGDPPALVPADEVLAGAPQGGRALQVESGRRSQGLQLVLDQPVPPGDLTIELVFTADVLEPEGNAFNFMYLGSNEWPHGGKFMWAFRRAGDQPFNFVAFGDGSGDTEIRLNAADRIAAGRWYHAAGVLDYNDEEPAESAVRFYLDGELQAEAAYDAIDDRWSLGSSNTRHPNSISIGYSNGQDANPYDSRGMSGAIDAFSISRDALRPGTFRLPLARQSDQREGGDE